jgi:ANTAR domain
MRCVLTMFRMKATNAEPPEAQLAVDGGENMAAVLATVRLLVSVLAGLSEQLRRGLPDDTPPSSASVLDDLRTENHQLKEALEGRAVIERAKGALMALHRCDEHDAFRMLVDQSRLQRRKVRAVAADLVRDLPVQPPPPSASASVVTPMRPAPSPPAP